MVVVFGPCAEMFFTAACLREFDGSCIEGVIEVNLHCDLMVITSPVLWAIYDYRVLEGGSSY